MWQEARKQEKILKGIMVDYKRRAERRKGFYDKIKKDPAEFLQIWGRNVKIHIDANIAAAADNPSIMTKWNGDADTLIDRFDARSNLDYYTEYKEPVNYEATLTESEKNEEKLLNFERYRTLIQNEAFGINENQCLKQIETDEKFGSSTLNIPDKKLKEPKAQIGYTYQDSTIVHNKVELTAAKNKSPESDLSDEIENDDDLDIALDLKKLTAENKVILNKCATNYGLEFGDFIRISILENDEKEQIKKNKLLEAEKAQYSGRKSRRGRRIFKDKLRKEKGDISPLSFIVAKTSPNSSRSCSSRSSESSSTSPKYSKTDSSQNKVMFITSFGADNEDNENENIEDLLPKKANKQQNETLLNFKSLKENTKFSLLRSTHSRSKSKSPVLNEKILNKNKLNDNSSSSDNTNSDEDEALKKYLKRRENRKQTTKSAANSNSSMTSQKLVALKNLSSVSSSINKLDAIPNSNSNNNNNNSDNGGSSSKFRSTDEFKLHQDKLKKKMQQQINMQLKKDKELEKQKQKKEKNERREREAELTYLTEKVKQKRALERRKNRRRDGLDSSSSDESNRSRSRSKSPILKRNSRKSRSFSKSSSSSRTRSRSKRSRTRSRSRRFRTRSRSRRSRTRSRSRRSRTRSRSSSDSSRRRYCSRSSKRTHSPKYKRKRTSSTSTSSSSSSSSSSSKMKSKSSSSSSDSSD